MPSWRISVVGIKNTSGGTVPENSINLCFIVCVDRNFQYFACDLLKKKNG